MCPIAQDGLIRLLSHPRYDAEASGVPDLIGRLRAFRASGNHEFRSHGAPPRAL
jgi:hypothetical protein